MPVGRISMLYMYPLSFLEYLVATNNHLIGKEILDHPIAIPMEEAVHKKILDLLGEYLSIGGMSEAVARWTQTQEPDSAATAVRYVAFIFF